MGEANSAKCDTKKFSFIGIYQDITAPQNQVKSNAR
jgi:hypothetical protein